MEQSDGPNVQCRAGRCEQPEPPDRLSYGALGPQPADDGVDRGLIRWFQSLTPAQRLDTLQSFVDLVVEARNARDAGALR